MEYRFQAPETFSNTFIAALSGFQSPSNTFCEFEDKKFRSLSKMMANHWI